MLFGRESFQGMPRLSITEQAKVFDAWYRRDGGHAATVHHRLVCQSTPEFVEHGVRSILDVGCGRGKLIHALLGEGYEVTGTEICPTLLEKDLKRMPVFPYSVTALSEFLDESFDLVLLVDLLDCLRDQEEVVECLVHADRLAKKGILATFGGPSPMRTTNQPNDFWRRTFKDVIGLPVDEKLDKSSRVVRLLSWRRE